VTKGFAFNVRLELTDSEMAVVLAGGQLRYLKDQLVKEGVIKES
jgi:aconitate hydratase